MTDETNFKYLAIYFRMGMYNKDDPVSSDLIGFDCPFEDSPVIYAKEKEELERKVRKIYDNGDCQEEGDLDSDWDGVDWQGIYPDVICDNQGNIQVELHKKITSDKTFHPDSEQYSFGRETLTELWKREKWRWIDD